MANLESLIPKIAEEDNQQKLRRDIREYADFVRKKSISGWILSSFS